MGRAEAYIAFNPLSGFRAIILPNAKANSDDMAGSVFYLAPVDNASGKIFGKKQKFVAVRRKQGKRQRGCAVIGERTTPYGASELAWQEKFAQICAATRERMIDPNHVAQDQADFAAQSKYKTFYQYVWSLMRDQIESGK